VVTSNPRHSPNENPDKEQVQMNNIVLPPPTPKHIEAALAAIRNGTSAFLRWFRLDYGYEYKAETARLWWVDINVEGELEARGGGMTSAEAAAVAWINIWTDPWGGRTGLSEEDDANVPRHVPEGWQFELHAAPCDPTERIVRQRARLRTLATLQRKSIARK
jgi:hypothetical protein